MLADIHRLQSLADEEEAVMASATAQADSHVSAQPQWMRSLLASVTAWLSLLPTVSYLIAVAKVNDNPLQILIVMKRK